MTAALMAWLGLVWQALLWYISRTRAKNAELLEEYQLAPYNELVSCPLHMPWCYNFQKTTNITWYHLWQMPGKREFQSKLCQAARLSHWVH